MKKNTMIAMIVAILVAILLYSIQCKHMEGMNLSSITEAGITQIDGTDANKLTDNNVLFSPNNVYCAFIDGTTLKIAKKNGNTWTEMWKSTDYNSTWTGATLSMDATGQLKLGNNLIGTGTSAILTNEGKLAIKNGDVVTPILQLDSLNVNGALSSTGQKYLVSEDWQYRARITDSGLKIYKLGANQPEILIWESNNSNSTWNGNTLTITSSELTFGDNKTIVSGLKDAAKLTLTTDGDLVIKDPLSKVIWSLIDSELQSTTAETNKYFGIASSTTRSTMSESLRLKVQNFGTYAENINIAISDDIKPLYKRLQDARYKMDFEIGELNGMGNSKVKVSTNTLESTMYVNLGLTVLAMSLLILIISR